MHSLNSYKARETSSGLMAINMYAGKYRLKYTTMAINNVVIIVEGSEEKAIRIKRMECLSKQHH